MSDTIFAPATAAGRAAVAIVRLSGPAVRFVLETIAGPLPEPRRASVRRLRDRDGSVLDQALVLWFPGPASFTGEDTAELHLHGGRAVVAVILDRLARFPGCRSAGPGEFTRRALSNGRMDLAEVEGLADLVDAETELQRRQALRQLDGRLSRAVGKWREMLLDASALLEAELDFADEGDVGPDAHRPAVWAIATVLQDIRSAERDAERGEIIRAGVTVVIAGPPNAGKSTLMNRLARRDVSIVTPHAGTTRDAVEARLELSGIPVTLVDTAGLRETDDAVEKIGVARGLELARSADLGLWVTPSGAVSELPPTDGEWIRIRSKSDLRPGAEVLPGEIALSAETGDGLDVLLDRLRSRIAALAGSGSADPVAVRARHREALAKGARSLEAALALLGRDGPIELAAEEIRQALWALSELVGTVRVDDMLDRLFAGFCIGK